jgi:hypothetical protein
MAAIDLTGQRFGRLTVIERAEGRYTPWRCRCSCGNETVVISINLRRGNTKSCGCFNEELWTERIAAQTKHRMSGTPIYVVWRGMLARCYDPARKDFAGYGGRGWRTAAASKAIWIPRSTSASSKPAGQWPSLRRSTLRRGERSRSCRTLQPARSADGASRL